MKYIFAYLTNRQVWIYWHNNDFGADAGLLGGDWHDKNYQRPINTVMGSDTSMIENSIRKLTMAFSLEKIINVWLIGALAQLIKKVYPKRSAISAYLKMEDCVIWPINKKVWRNCCSSWLAMRSKIKAKHKSKANWKRKCRSWKRHYMTANIFK